MNKKTSILLALCSILISSIYNSKAETESSINHVETPTEILDRCAQDIATMNPDDKNSVKNILNIATEAMDIAIKEFEKSVNTLKKELTAKEGLFFKLKQLLTWRVQGLSFDEIYLCTEKTTYKIKKFLLSKNSRKLFESLSQHDQAIVSNISNYILARIKQQNDLFYYTYWHSTDFLKA